MMVLKLTNDPRSSVMMSSFIIITAARLREHVAVLESTLNTMHLNM